MKRFKIFSSILLASVLIVLLSCNSSDSNDPSMIGKSKISIRLMDDPGDFEHVYIDVVDVMVNFQTEDPDDENGWQSLEAVNTGIYDILELTGGVDVELVDNFEVEPGSLKQIRLVLGEQNSVVIDGEEFPLNTPSAQQSGLKIKINQDILPGFNYTFLLDFVVDESIVIAGNSGNINLKPVIRASLEAASGTIVGTVVPTGFAVEVIADNGNVQAATMTDSNGYFVIAGLSEGTYSLTVTPDPESGYEAVVLEGIDVIAGQLTDVGELSLE